MDYTEKMLFEFARMLNNYRKFESDEDMYHLIDEFLTKYKPHYRPERSKREDSQTIDEWLTSPECRKGTVEFGTCSGIQFITSNGVKKLEPGKQYDQGLNEL